MNIKMKKTVIYVMLTIFMVSFSACSGEKDKESQAVTAKAKSVYPAKLTAVLPEYNTSYIDAFKDFSSYISQALPEYDVNLITIKGDESAYDTKIRILQSADDIPDVFYSENNSHVKELLDNSDVIPIEKYLNELDFWNMVIPSAKVKGYRNQIYAVPFDGLSYEIIQYNVDIFKKNKISVPTTADQLKHIVDVLNANKITPIAIGAKDGYPAAMMMEGFAYSMDPQITKNIAAKKANFSDKPYKIAATKVKELLDANAFEKDAQNTSDEDAFKLYCEGKTAMYFGTSNNFEEANTKLKGKNAFMYYPVLDNSVKQNYGKYCAGGVKPDSGLFIDASSKHPIDAVKLAVEMSKFYSKYLYEEKNDPNIIFNESALKLNQNNKIEIPVVNFMSNVKSFETSNEFIQDIIPNTDAVKSINESSAEFMKGYISVDDYLKGMDMVIQDK